MKRLFFIFGTFFIVGSIYCQQLITLQEGTIVKIELIENLDSRVSKLGDMVNLEVTEDVYTNGILVIKKGDKAVGRICKSAPAKWAGKKGELDFTIDYVTSYFGKNIRIRSTNSSDGTSRMGGVIAGAVFLSAPIVLLIKGKDVTINKGAQFPTYIDKDYEFKLSEIEEKK